MADEVFGFNRDGVQRTAETNRRVLGRRPDTGRRTRRVFPNAVSSSNGWPHDCCSPCNPFECTAGSISIDDCAAYPNGSNGWEVNFGAMFEDCCPGAGGKQWMTYHGNCEFWGPDLSCTAYSPTQWILTIREGKKSTLVLDLGGAGQVVFRSVRNWCRQCPNEMRLCGPVPACVRHYLGTVCVYPRFYIPKTCCSPLDPDPPVEWQFEVSGITGAPCCEALNGHWVLTFSGFGRLLGFCDGVFYGTDSVDAPLLPVWSGPAVSDCARSGSLGSFPGGWSMTVGWSDENASCHPDCYVLSGGTPSVDPGVASEISLLYRSCCLDRSFCTEPIGFGLVWGLDGAGNPRSRGCGSNVTDYPPGLTVYPVT